MNITKLQLCDRVASKLDYKNGPALTALELKDVLDQCLNEILIVLSENKNIEIRSFGSFKTKSRKGRTGRNPRTGDPVIIKEYIIPIFKVSKEGQNIFDLKVKNRSKAAKAPTTV